ncbi:hypothetical protein ASZ90_019594 [hydrocarbon metagenome]|uniref:Uncharacterized protein n=1 Tax=hydrocarbon metagenome TaxID=938273 RepID=A0A0W8E3A1_9ZZZZ
MINTFAVHPAASKSLIARAVCELPEVKSAYKNGRIFIGHGTTNLAVAQHLLNIKLDNPSTYVSGVITQQASCATDSQLRCAPWCIEKGRILEVDWQEFLTSFTGGDIFIKGANAIDPYGNAGILLGDPQGGTIGKSIGILKARGIQIIIPTGLEKMIPSCQAAEKVMGIEKTAQLIGMKTGYMCLSGATIITEIESIKILLDIDAVQVAAGGVGGMEGSVVLAAGYKNDETTHKLLQMIKEANRTPRLSINKQKCSTCDHPCDYIDKP